MKITAVSLSYRQSGTDLPAALFCGADDAILFDFNDGTEQDSAPDFQSQSAILAEIAKKSGKIDIFIAPQGLFCKKMADFLSAEHYFVKNAADMEVILLKMQEKPVFAEISENFSADCTDLPGIAAIRDASTRPVYSWSFDDIGIASGLFLRKF